MAEIMISNKLTASYDLKGYGESSIDVTLTVGVYIDNEINVEISTTAKAHSNKRVDIEVVFNGISNIGVEISPSVINNIPVEIEVNPHNKMSVYYELSTPPIITFKTFPVQDSFVIENAPYSNINYGTNNSMIVGVDQKGKNIAFVKFDTSAIPLGVTLKSAKARFYYNQLSIEGLEISKVNQNWQELGITYNNRPTDLENLNQSYIIDEVGRYVEFDVTSSVDGWVKGLANYGFALTSDNGVSVFGTREFPLSPDLIVEYYSPLPFSSDISKKEIEITVARNEHSDIEVELEVKTNFRFSNVPIEIFTKQKDEVFNEDIEVEIEVPVYSDSSEIEIQITVLLDGISDIEVELEVPVYNENSDIEVQLSVSLDDISEIEVELEVPNSLAISNIEVQLTVELKADSNVEIELEVPIYNGINELEVEIEVLSMNYEYVDIPIEITVYSNDNSSIEIEVECINNNVNFKDISVEITIPSYVDETLEVEITVPIYNGESELPIDIEVPVRLVDDEIQISIVVFGKSESNIEFEVSCRVDYISQLEVEIEVGKSSRYAYVFMS